MTSSTDLFEAVQRVLEAQTDNFFDLFVLAGLSEKEDLKHADLRGIDFSGRDLAGFDFTGADVDDCSFQDATITDATFDEFQVLSGVLNNANDWVEFSSKTAALRPATTDTIDTAKAALSLPNLVVRPFYKGALEDARSGRNMQICGWRGSGKTTALRVIEEELRKRNIAYLFASHATASPIETSALIVDQRANGQIVDALRSAIDQIELLDEGTSSDPAAVSAALASALVEFPGLTLIVDDIDQFGKVPLEVMLIACLAANVKVIASCRSKFEWPRTATRIANVGVVDIPSPTLDELKSFVAQFPSPAIGPRELRALEGLDFRHVRNIISELGENNIRRRTMGYFTQLFRYEKFKNRSRVECLHIARVLMQIARRGRQGVNNYTLSRDFEEYQYVSDEVISFCVENGLLFQRNATEFRTRSGEWIRWIETQSERQFLIL